MTHTVRHTIHTDPATFWRLTFDEVVARALMASLGNAGDFKIAEDRTESSGLRHRRVEVWTKTQVPPLVKKFVGDGSYVETGTFDPKIQRYAAECIPLVNGDKFRTRYEITTEASPAGGGCTRIITTENTVRVLGLGAIIVGKLEAAQLKSHDHSAAFLNDWIQGQR